MTKKCEERVQEALNSRLEDLREVFGTDEFCDYGLSFDYVARFTFRDQVDGFFRYQISWGGPSEEFRFLTEDPDDRYPTVEFWFLDWFDGACITLSGKDLELLHDIWDFFVEIGATQHQKEQNEDPPICEICEEREGEQFIAGEHYCNMCAPPVCEDCEDAIALDEPLNDTYYCEHCWPDCDFCNKPAAIQVNDTFYCKSCFGEGDPHDK